MNKAEIDMLKDEWSAGSLLNPFWLIDETVYEYISSRIVKHSSLPALKISKIQKDAIENICISISEAFIDCTSYRVAENALIKAGEKELMTAMLIYVYSEGPPCEQNMMMICELVRAELTGDYSVKTDLEKLFDHLAEKGHNHTAISHFNAYLSNPAGRKNIISSLSKRLSPLISFGANEGQNIFKHCSGDELIEMAVALLNNCTDVPEGSSRLENNIDEISLVAAVLCFIYEECAFEDQLADLVFKILSNPSLIIPYMESLAPTAKALTFWHRCRANVLAGEYDKGRVLSIEKFFREFW